MKRKRALLLTLLAFLPLCYTVAFFATARCASCDTFGLIPGPSGLAVWYSNSRPLNAALCMIFAPLFAVVHSACGPGIWVEPDPEPLEVSGGALPRDVTLCLLRHPLAIAVLGANALALFYWIVQACCFWRDCRRRAAGLCIRCGYSLRGNVSGRCPECGTEVGVLPDPAGVVREQEG